MPLHDVGYRGWSGTRSDLRTRWLTIAATGIRLIWRGTWIRRTFLFTWLPVLLLASGFLIYEQAGTDPESREFIREVFRVSIGSPEMYEAYLNSPEMERQTIWGMLLFSFFRYPQSFAIILLIGVIAPRLISYDLRSRGYLLYFSRPVTPTGYLLGKSAIVWFYVCLITTIPALAMYAMGVLLSSEWRVVFDTWQLPFRILIASAVLIIPTTSLALAYSALTLESRYATLAWIATWVVGWVAYAVFGFATQFSAQFQPTEQGTEIRQDFRPQTSGRRGKLERFQRRIAEAGSVESAYERWEWVSLYHNLVRVQLWAFGFDKTSNTSVIPHALILGFVTVGSWLIAFWRISGRLRV